MTQTMEIEEPRERGDGMPVFTRVDLSGLMTSEPPQPRSVVEPIMPTDETTLLGGDGGSGKTLLAMAIGACVTCGRAWGPFKTITGRVLFASLEDPPDKVRFRIRRIVDQYALDPDTVLENFTVLDASNTECALAYDQSIDGIRALATNTPAMEELRTAAAGHALVIIDNGSDGYAGNENERRQVRAFVRELNKIARAVHCAVLLLVHLDKSAVRNGGNGSTYSGSTAWNNSVRSRLALLKTDTGLELRHEKANYARLAEPVRVEFTAHGVLVPLDVGSRQRAAESQVMADAESVVVALARLGAEGMNVPTAATGGYTAWHVLATVAEVGAMGKDRVKRALVNLERSGRVVRIEYRANRKSREGFALAQNVTVEGVPIPAPIYPPIPPSSIGARATPAPAAGEGIGAASAQIGASARNGTSSSGPADWLANADPDIKRRVEAFRMNGSNHD